MKGGCKVIRPGMCELADVHKAEARPTLSDKAQCKVASADVVKRARASCGTARCTLKQTHAAGDVRDAQVAYVGIVAPRDTESLSCVLRLSPS